MRSVVLALFIAGVIAGGNKTLQFNKNGKFKMVQFTDIHFGESDETDRANEKLIADVLEAEKPDLAVITGDVVSGYAWDGKTENWAALQYQNMTKVLIEH